MISQFNLENVSCTFAKMLVNIRILCEVRKTQHQNLEFGPISFRMWHNFFIIDGILALNNPQFQFFKLETEKTFNG